MIAVIVLMNSCHVFKAADQEVRRQPDGDQRGAEDEEQGATRDVAGMGGEAVEDGRIAVEFLGHGPNIPGRGANYTVT